MNSSTSSSDAPSSKPAKTSAGLFLASMAGGIIATIAAVSFAPESWIHTGPEYGMAEAFEDHIQSACATKEAPDLLIIGDSRAVAGVSVETIRASGIKAEKFALGGAGIFAGWAVLDRLIDCGVKPKSVVMAYGTIHMLEEGAVMDRTANYDVLKGPTAGREYAMASAWEDRKARQLAYKAVSMFGTELTGLDFVLMRPALRNVLERPPLAIENHMINEREHKKFYASNGDRYYGQADSTSELPDEAAFTDNQSVPMALDATKAVAELGKTHGFPVYFYILPVSQTAKTGLRPAIFDMAAKFRSQLPGLGITVLNDVWVLPDADFGDPSHVNSKGRPVVTADFVKRYSEATAGVSASETAAKAGVPGRPVEANDTVSLAVQKLDQARQ